MPKKIVWKNPNKMLFESSLPSYDNYVECIGRNTMTRGWTSFIVRSFNTTECGINNTRAPGYFTQWDLDHASIPQDIKSAILKWCKNNPDKDISWARMSTAQGTEWYMLYTHTEIVTMFCKTQKQYDVCVEAFKYLID